jgi:restriction system protein
MSSYYNNIDEVFDAVLSVANHLNLKINHIDQDFDKIQIVTYSNNAKIRIDILNHNSKTGIYLYYPDSNANIKNNIIKMLNSTLNVVPRSKKSFNPTDKIKGKTKKGKLLLELKNDKLELNYKSEFNDDRTIEFIDLEDIKEITFNKGLFSGNMSLISSNYKINLKNVDNSKGNEFVYNVRSAQTKLINTKKKLAKEQNTKRNLEISDNLVYIENFANRFKNNYKFDDVKKLKDLLSSKGINIIISELKSIIDSEIERQEFNEFKEKISYNNPTTLNEYILNLMEIYGENYPHLLNYFKRILKDNKIDYSEYKISSTIDQLNKEKELNLFEEELFATVDSGKSSFISIHDIDQLDGYQFEGLLKILFEKMGYKTINTPLSGDQGADLVITKFNNKIVVQAKCYSSKVTNKAVQEVVASIAQYNANKGMVITNNEFTISAIELADSNNIELIGRAKLDNLIHQYPITKNEF